MDKKPNDIHKTFIPTKIKKPYRTELTLTQQ